MYRKPKVIRLEKPTGYCCIRKSNFLLWESHSTLKYTFLSKAFPFCLNILVIKYTKTSLGTTLLIIYHQRHVSSV